jgi:hypothetical protein
MCGPHLRNGESVRVRARVSKGVSQSFAVAIGTRNMHGCDIELTPWTVKNLLNPTWVKMPVDIPMAPLSGEACLPPFVLLMCPDVTRVPLYPHGGKGFGGAPQPGSDVVVAYDPLFRL